MLVRKNFYLLIGIAIPLILIVIFYYWQLNKIVISPNDENKSLATEDISKPLINNYDQPLNIDIQNINWVKAQFPGNGYHHDLDLWYPSTWQFAAGGDTDNFSQFWIQPWPNEDLAKQPHVTVTDFGLYGCPKTKPECSIDQYVAKTPQEIFAEQLSAIKDYQKVYLDNLKTNAVKYEADDFIEQVLARQYLINTGKGVSLVAFFQFDKLGEDFINEFLQRLQVNK